MKKLLLIIALCVLVDITAQAQCAIKTTTTNNKVIIETSEAYVYTRQLNQYHALAIKAIKIKSDTSAKTILRISETSTSVIIPQFIRITFKDSTYTEQKLQYIQKLKVDNKAFNTRSLNLLLSTGATNRLSTTPISRFTLLSAAKAQLTTIPADNNDVLIQLLQCIAQY